MKNLKCLLICTGIAGAMLAAPAPKPQTGTGRDLIDTALTVHRFNTFLMLAREADLAFNLKGSGPFTIFAPTDEAFNRMPPGLLDRIQGNPPRLRAFLLNHVVRGSYTAQQTVRARSLPTLNGGRLNTRNVEGHGMIGNAGFSIANILASNGIMHGIDHVLMSQ